MKQYFNLIGKIMHSGIDSEERTGTGARSIFGHQMRFDLQLGFPLLTAKKTGFNAIAHELLWFLSGSTNIKYLQDNNVVIWNEWADPDGDLGPVYGKQWREFSGIDQITNVINQIKTNPRSRRLIVSAWNPADIDKMALPPCHALFQFHVQSNQWGTDILSCQLYQRSVDTFLGLPFNIASYALLTHMIAHQCGLCVGDLIHTSGNAHIYHNHFDQVNQLMSRKDKAPPSPMLDIKRKPDSIFDYTIDDFDLIGYKPLPFIKAEVAV